MKTKHANGSDTQTLWIFPEEFTGSLISRRYTYRFDDQEITQKELKKLLKVSGLGRLSVEKIPGKRVSVNIVPTDIQRLLAARHIQGYELPGRLKYKIVS